ncbi:pyridoxal phosphate-dependent transferase [Diplogelasinospora grovesii]|uniref:Pyridoxal phosphate-dependent transferase n=1 Tax=Diplogelasinospora grovesii TaxID=303347 RepID=A0AAN6NGW3_9PEZI|nr:pyridoxal phosphate-dependent transferase [Diplogelasinospora grovesii]
MGQSFSTCSSLGRSSKRTPEKEAKHDFFSDTTSGRASSSETASTTPNDGVEDGLRPFLAKAKGHYWYTTTGTKILDACGGAGVACIGHGRKDVMKAVASQMRRYSYTSYAHFRAQPVVELEEFLVESTGGKMQRVYLLCSGSEAVESSLKLAREYFLWVGQPQRVNFIARWESYHGASLGALSVGGHVARRAPFEPLLQQGRFGRISPCNPYRQRLTNPDGTVESDDQFVERKVAELEQEFQRLGPDTVCAVILEPVVGAALGCAPAVPGYLRAAKQVCDRHGALLILDEVMSGMGRTGSLHAWEQEGIVPDLQTIAKGFGGGYQPASALLVGHKIAGTMKKEGKVFTHGHTYQNHPVVAAAALKVQSIIRDDNLLENVRAQGELLGRLLKERIGEHPNVGDIRGRGLFWGIEFVRDKTTKQPFDPTLQIALQVYKTAMQEMRVLVYTGQGCAGNGKGDHIMIMPAYNISGKLVRELVERVAGAIERVFERY